jgi:hypothetical protein
MRSISTFIVAFVLACLLAAPFAIAQSSFDDDSGSWGTSTESSSSSSDDDDDDDTDTDEQYQGTWGNNDGDDEDYDAEDAPGFAMYFGMKIYCHVRDRDTMDSFVVYDDASINSDDKYDYGHLYTDDIATDIDNRLPLFPLKSNGDSDLDYFNDYYWKTTPSITITTWSEDEYENAKLHRFEGVADTKYEEWPSYGCIPFLGFLNVINFMSSTDIFGFDLTGSILDPTDGGELAVRTWGFPEYDGETLGYDITWDNGDGADCEAIGGDWLSETEAGIFSSTSVGKYRCCGDDAMWINNRAVDSSGFGSSITDGEREDIAAGDTSSSEFCLYSSGEIPNDVTIEHYSTETELYTCGPTGFTAYDDTLDLDVETTDDEGYERAESREVPFFFQGVADSTETDIGKWSDDDDLNPHFCYYSWSETTGETYEWKDNINELGDQPVNDDGEEFDVVKGNEQETICEKYLGGTWTGQYCCGNKYNYNDDAWTIAPVDEYFGESFSDTEPIYYSESDQIHTNYACVQGIAIDSEATEWFDAEDYEVEIELLNVDGNLYACNYDELTADYGSTILSYDYYRFTTNAGDEQLISSGVDESDEENAFQADACAILNKRFLCNYVADAEDDGQYEWQWYDMNDGSSEASYITNTLAHSSSSNPNYEFTWSPIEWVDENEDYTEGACCAGNSCWDGDECVEATTEHYYGGNDDDVLDEGESVAICSEGTWQLDVPDKYDWYYNTDVEAISYCANQFSCVCSSNDDDDTYCTDGVYEDTDGFEVSYIEGGCTTVKDFFKDDHLCESDAVDSNGDGTYEGLWTSRTKHLAFQMLEIATNVGTDFTLYCDEYENAVNNYEQMSDVDSINNVCILSQGDETLFGVTFNWDDDENAMVINEETLADLLEEGSDGLLDDALQAEVTDCSDALEQSHSYNFGNFLACESSTTVYYNEIIDAVIYAKDEMNSAAYSSSSTLYYPGENSGINFQTDILDTYQSTIWDTYITSGSYNILNPDETDLYDEGYFDPFEYVADYNTLYYSYDTRSGSAKSIFGFEEIKYSESGDDNRYFMGLVYNGYDLDCDQIYAPYETTWTINCNADVSGQGIILERSTSGSEHWNDLTAAVRVYE